MKQNKRLLQISSGALATFKLEESSKKQGKIRNVVSQLKGYQDIDSVLLLK